MSVSEINLRDRFYSCNEETIEDFIGFKTPQCKRKRPTTKTSRKQLLLKCYENRSKKHGKKVDRSPPPKATKYSTSESDKGNTEIENEENEDDDEDDNEEEEEVEGEGEGEGNKDKVEAIILLDGNNEKDNQESNTIKCVNIKETASKPDVTVEDEMTADYNTNSNKECIDCGVMYNGNKNDKNDKAKRKCRICKCNEHGCLILLNNTVSKGDTWLCGECLRLTTMVERKHPDLYENLRKTLVTKDTKRMKTTSTPNKTSTNKEGGIKNKERTAGISRESRKEEQRGKRGIEDDLQKKILNPGLYRDVALFEEDLQSLNDGKWISDAIIAFWFRYLEEDVYKDNQDIIFIPPSITQVFKQGLTDTFRIFANELNIGQRKYVLLAVNNNKLDKAGGYHWSLLVYKVKDDAWLHYDSLEDLNLCEAKTIVSRMQEYLKPGSTPKLDVVCSTQQRNSYDCGAYTMINAQLVALTLTLELPISPVDVDKEDITNLRRVVRGLLTSSRKQEMKYVSVPSNFDGVEDNILIASQNPTLKKPIQPSPQPRNTIKKSDTTNLGLADVKKYPNINRDKICPFLTRGTCRYGAKGENSLGKCHKYHPNQCKDYNLNGTTEKGCKNGKECSNWHATYICLLSANSNMCTRINCQFKHHKSCTTTGDNDNFLENNQHYKTPKLYQSLEYPPLTNRQPPQLQHQLQRRPHHHHQRYQHQPQKMHMGHTRQANNKIPHTNQRQYNKLPQVSEDRLIHLIRTVIREETNNLY